MFGFLASIAWKELGAKALGNAASDARAAGKWIGSLDLVHFLLLVACLFGGWQTFGRWSQHRHTAKVEGQLSQCTKARGDDAKRYADAQAKAAADNKAQVANTEAKYERISSNEKQSYANDRARLHVYYDGLLSQALADSGHPGSAASPSDSAASAGTDGARLQVPAAELVQTKEDAAEIELRLMHLQNYVDGLLGVDPNEEPKP